MNKNLKTIFLHLDGIALSPIFEILSSYSIDQYLLSSSKFKMANIIDKYKANSGLTIENNFDGNLNGGISQLRFYTKPLSVDKLIHNFNVERGRYGRNETWGGRIINIDTGTES